jgi:hypothetical protein
VRHQPSSAADDRLERESRYRTRYRRAGGAGAVNQSPGRDRRICCAVQGNEGRESGTSVGDWFFSKTALNRGSGDPFSLHGYRSIVVCCTARRAAALSHIIRRKPNASYIHTYIQLYNCAGRFDTREFYPSIYCMLFFTLLF